MKRKTNSLLMLAYISFIFVAVFTRHLYAQSKWNYIVTAITATSWILVLSDTFAAAADFLQEAVLTTKPEFERYLFRIRHNRSINNRLDVPLKDEHGNDTGKTIGQTLDFIEKSTLGSISTLEKGETIKKGFVIFAKLFMLAGFVIFYCVLLFEPVFEFFHKKLDGMTMLAFGTILATQFLGNILKERVHQIRNDLDAINKGIEALNKSYEAEGSSNAD